MLFRIHGDPEHPFSEVVGVLRRIERRPESQRTFFEVLRRDGTLVAVADDDVMKFKILEGRRVRET